MTRKRIEERRGIRENGKGRNWKRGQVDVNGIARTWNRDEKVRVDCDGKDEEGL